MIGVSHSKVEQSDFAANDKFSCNGLAEAVTVRTK